MKKRDNYFLDKHKRWMKKGFLDRSGLCIEFGRNETFEMFEPTAEDEEVLVKEGKSDFVWGDGRTQSEVSEDFNRTLKFRYTPLRQTIVLFCHEILNS